MNILVRPIAIEKIVAAHPDIDDLYRELAVPPMQFIPNGFLTDAQLKDLIKTYPISVVEGDDRKYRCTGNLRLYHLAKTLLGGATPVHCQVIETPKPERMREKALTELFFGPACLGVRQDDIARLMVAFESAANQNLIAPNGSPSLTPEYFSGLYGIDRVQSTQAGNALPTAAPLKPERFRPGKSDGPSGNIRYGGRQIGTLTVTRILPAKESVLRWLEARADFLTAFERRTGHKLEQPVSAETISLHKKGIPTDLVVSRQVFLAMIAGSVAPLSGAKPSLYMAERDLNAVLSQFCPDAPDEPDGPGEPFNFPELDRLRNETEQLIKLIPDCMVGDFDFDAALALPDDSAVLKFTAAVALLLSCPVWCAPGEHFWEQIKTIPGNTQPDLNGGDE